MSHLLEKHNIEVPDDLEKPTKPSKHYHSVQPKGNITYTLSARFKYLLNFSDIYSFSDISES